MSFISSVSPKKDLLAQLEGTRLFTVKQKNFLVAVWDKLPNENQDELLELLTKEQLLRQDHAQHLERTHAQLLKNAIARVRAVKRAITQRLIVKSENECGALKNPEQELIESLKNL